MRVIDLTEDYFSYNLGDAVALDLTGEAGCVRGFRRIVDEVEDFYLVEYVNNADCLVEEWFRESALAAYQPN